jgi:hypothetical protein
MTSFRVTLDILRIDVLEKGRRTSDKSDSGGLDQDVYIAMRTGD